MQRALKILMVGIMTAAVLSVTSCGQTDQAVCDDIRVLERQLDTVEGEIRPEIAEEVRDDYAEIATDANCPGYDAED